MLLLSRVLTVCSALGSTCLLACPLEVDGPIGDNLPSFLMLLLVGVILLPLPPPRRPPKCQNAAAASPQGGRTEQNTATKTKATKGERTDDTRLGWDRPRPRSDGRRSQSEGRTARSPWEISAAAGKFMAEKSSSALFLLFLPLFFIFLTFSRPCQPPLFSFGVHHSKTYVSAKFLRMFDMKM